MQTVVVTGGIGSGKSAVCALLRKRGLPVYDADSRTKSLYDRRPALVTQMEKALSVPLRSADGRLDRGLLARLIFSDEAARRTVEDIVYPAVLQDYRRWNRRQKEAPYAVLESAVILSKPVFDGLADAVVLVDAPEEVRVERVMRRDGLSRAEVLARMAAQELPRERADIVLCNDGSPEALEAEVSRVFFGENSYLCTILKKSVVL